ncbi:hypothetical protein COLO4_29861 [Corchorus olitorius]|uniref:Prolamin-like domain-containing protein n=1 Tax=Corchorus olitorius TaxID=93759 RepID=A0A1R3HCV4_9ROSI|nr:hypothetical protein COLO4_29861 [Corchorus olitorius]
MANALKLLPFLVILVALIMTSVSLARSLALEMTPNQSLIAGLKLEEESPSCWEFLRQLQPCAGEDILFFRLGQNYFSDACCLSIINTLGRECSNLTPWLL